MYKQAIARELEALFPGRLKPVFFPWFVREWSSFLAERTQGMLPLEKLLSIDRVFATYEALFETLESTKGMIETKIRPDADIRKDIGLNDQTIYGFYARLPHPRPHACDVLQQKTVGEICDVVIERVTPSLSYAG